MPDEQNLRDDLLNQNGWSRCLRSALTDKVLARDEMQVKRLRRIVCTSWIVFLVSVVVTLGIELIAKPPRKYFAPAAVIVVQGLLIISWILSISLYVRSRTLTTNQIQARLARIEEQLRALLGKE